jgi:glutathione S-transferase
VPVGPAITIYQFSGTEKLESISPYCLKVHRLLNRKKLRFEVEDLLLPREIGKINPIGKLPAIRYDGQIVADSAHIARFLEAQHPDPPFFPKEEGLRARNAILEDWADEALYFSQMYFRWFPEENRRRTNQALFARTRFPLSLIGRLLAPGQVRKLAKTQGTGRKTYDMVRGEFSELMDALDALCAGNPFLLGADPYLADIAIFSFLRGLLAGLTPDAEGIILSRPRLAEWLKRVDGATRPL